MEDEMVAPIEVSEEGAIADYTDDSDIHLHMESMQDSKSDVDTDLVEEGVELIDKSGDETAIEDIDKVQLDHMEHAVPPISPAKAVLKSTDENDHLSEEDVAKVLHTLEPVVKKESELTTTTTSSVPEASASRTTSEYSISPGRPPKTEFTPEEAELARKQLEQLNQTTKGRPKGSAKLRHVDIVDDSGQMIKVPFQVVREKKQAVAVSASHNGRNDKSAPIIKDNDHEILNPLVGPSSVAPKSFKQNRLSLKKGSTLITPVKPPIKPDPANTGTIEIPNELILGADDINETMILNTSAGSVSKSLQNEDLIAILEGSDTEADTGSAPMDKETEKLLAMQQMMTLPLKPRGRRPKAANAKEVVRSKTVIKQEPVSDLVSSLVSEWSESDNDDSKGDEKVPITIKTEFPLSKPKAVSVAAKIIPPPAVGVFKRSRIIKKKIIWDPDAPETAISYASRVQPTAITKKIVASTTVKKTEPPRILNKKAPVDHAANSDARSHKRTTESPSPSGQKKRKISEVDKLLGDEGAINMLNALKQENNNADTDSTKSGRESVTKLRITKPTLKRDSVSPTNVVPKPRVKRPQTPQKPTAAPSTGSVAGSSSATKKDSGPKRKKAAAGSQSWDYIYSQRNEDSLIIRRRSNSSYSSTTSPSRLSIDALPQPSVSSSSTGKIQKTGKAKDKNFEFAKPNARKPHADAKTSPHSILMDIQTKPTKAVLATGKNASAASVRRSARAVIGPDCPTTGSPPAAVSVRAGDDKLTAKEKRAIQKSEMEIEAKRKADATKEAITVTRHKEVAHIVLRPDDKKLRNVFTTTVSKDSY